DAGVQRRTLTTGAPAIGNAVLALRGTIMVWVPADAARAGDDVRGEMMPMRRGIGAAIICAGSLLAALPARAVDLTGLWITDLEACNKVFTGTGTKAAFRRDSDMAGSGFIIDGKRIRGRTASCTIDKMQEKDGITHMLASCATEIMLQN